MARIVAGVQYLGTNFHGFQSQKDLPTIQSKLEYALSQIADEKIKITCSGRTDAGVHALEQVIHFNTTKNRTTRSWVFGANRYLPPDISLLWVKEIGDDFHARFNAVARQYNYLIYNSPVRSALKKDTHLWEPRKLDVQSMQDAAKLLVGEHDFKSFQDSQCQAKSSIKTIEFLTITQKAEEIIIDIKANAFLHHMVRNIVGTLLKIGYGDKKISWMQEVLDAKDRRAAGMTVPPQGLYFIKAFYPDKFNLNKQKIS